MIITDALLFHKIQNHGNLPFEVFSVKQMLYKQLRKCVKQLTKCINTKNLIDFVHDKKIYVIENQECKFFYDLMVMHVQERNYMEMKWCEMFNFENLPCI